MLQEVGYHKLQKDGAITLLTGYGMLVCIPLSMRVKILWISQLLLKNNYITRWTLTYIIVPCPNLQGMVTYCCQVCGAHSASCAEYFTSL